MSGPRRGGGGGDGGGAGAGTGAEGDEGDAEIDAALLRGLASDEADADAVLAREASLPPTREREGIEVEDVLATNDREFRIDELDLDGLTPRGMSPLVAFGGGAADDTGDDVEGSRSV